MQHAQPLASRFREVILSGTWIANTNYKHQLQDSGLETVTAKVGSLNTISILAQHIHYYIAGMIVAFKEGRLDIKDKFSFDFPPVETQAAWESFLSKFWSDAEEFAFLVEQMSDEKLQQPFIDERYGTFYRNIDAMIEHSYYHLGQIALIKKMLHGNT